MADSRKDTTTFGLSSKTVARLLKLGSEHKGNKVSVDDAQCRAEILHDRLAETLPFCETPADPTSRRQTRMSGTIGALAGESIGTLLLAPGTDIDTLKRIKDHGRKLSESTKSKPEHHVANTIYYAAIASALAHCDEKITAHAFSGLSTSFSKLSQEQWLPKTFARLFTKAAKISQDRCTP